MSRHMTMVLVDTFEALEESDVTLESYQTSVKELISHFKDDFCGLISSDSHNDYDESELQEAVIGYLEPDRLISQIKKYVDKNFEEAITRLEIADNLLKKHNTNISKLLAPHNTNRISEDKYIEGLWKAADALNMLTGREGIDLYFYDLTDSSARISEAQMKSIKENPEAYSLIPIAFRY